MVFEKIATVVVLRHLTLDGLKSWKGVVELHWMMDVMYSEKMDVMINWKEDDWHLDHSLQGD